MQKISPPKKPLFSTPPSPWKPSRLLPTLVAFGGLLGGVFSALLSSPPLAYALPPTFQEVAARLQDCCEACWLSPPDSRCPLRCCTPAILSISATGLSMGIATFLGTQTVPTLVMVSFGLTTGSTSMICCGIAFEDLEAIRYQSRRRRIRRLYALTHQPYHAPFSLTALDLPARQRLEQALRAGISPEQAEQLGPLQALYVLQPDDDDEGQPSCLAAPLPHPPPTP